MELRPEQMDYLVLRCLYLLRCNDSTCSMQSKTEYCTARLQIVNVLHNIRRMIK